MEGYPKHAALLLIKDTLKCWLNDNQGFCILIGGPGARVPNIQTFRYYVRCFGEIIFRNSARSCVIDAACNIGFLLLGDARALSMSDRFAKVNRRASQRPLPRDEGKAEINGFISADQLGPVLEGLGGDLSIRKVKNIPPMGIMRHRVSDSTGCLKGECMDAFTLLICSNPT